MKKNYYSKTKILDQTVKKSNKSVFLLFLMFVLGLTHTYAQDEFITTWTVEADDLSITIPIFDKDKLVDGEIVENEDGITYQYDFTVDWGDLITTGITTTESEDNALTHTYDDPGTYEVKISGTFPAISFGDSDSDNQAKIQTVKQWGNIEWQSMRDAFRNCTNLQVTAADKPDLDDVTSMAGMFRSCSKLTGGDIFKEWEVGNVTNMLGLFQSSPAFNADIGGWDVENVGNMFAMFFNASSFGQDLGDWQLNNVTNMGSIFTNSAMNCAYYSVTLIGWAENGDIHDGITLGTLPYGDDTETVAAIAILAAKGWDIPLNVDGSCTEDVETDDESFESFLVARYDINNDGKISVGEAEAVRSSDLDAIEELGVTHYVMRISGSGIESLKGIEAFVNITGIQAYNHELSTIDVTALSKLTYLNLANQKESESGGPGQREIPGNLDRAGITEIDLSGNPELMFLHVGQNALTSLDVSNNPKLTGVEAGNNKLTSFDASTLNQGIAYDVDEDGNIIQELTGIQRLDLKHNELVALNLANGLNALDDGSLNPTFLSRILLLRRVASGLAYERDPHNNELSCIQFDMDLNLEVLPETIFGNNSELTYRGRTIFSNGPCDIDIPDETFKKMLTTADGDGVTGVLDHNGGAVFGHGVDTDGNGEISYGEAAAFTGVLNLGNLRPQITDLTGIEAFTNLTGLLVYGNALTVLDMSKNVKLEHFNASSQIVDDESTLIALNLANGNNENMEDGEGANGFWNFGNPNLSCLFVDNPENSETRWTRRDDTTTFCTNYLMINARDDVLEDDDDTYDEDVMDLLKPIHYVFASRLLYHHINANPELGGVGTLNLNGNGGKGGAVAEEINIHFVDRVEESVADSFYANSATVNGNRVLDPASVISYYEAHAFTGKLWLDSQKQYNANGWTGAYYQITDFNGDSDDTGLETFINATELDMSNAFDVVEETVNLSSLTKLVALDISVSNWGKTGGVLDETATLDLSQNTALEKLYLSWNEITTLDLSNNPELIELDVSDNRLAELNVSQNTKLTNLVVYKNDIAELDLSNNPELIELDVSRNYMESMDLSRLSKLEVLRAELNELTSLDVSNNPELTELSLFHNQLNLLNIANGENEILTSLYLSQLDDVNFLGATAGYGRAINDEGSQRNDNYYNFIENVDLRINGDNEASCILVDDANYSSDENNWEFRENYRFVDFKDFTTDYTVVLGDNGEYTLTPEDVYNSSQSDCLNVSLSFGSDSQTEFTCADVGTSVDVRLFVTYGDITYDDFATVEITAGTQVMAITKDITVTLAGNGQYTLVPSDIDDGSGVVCGTGNVTLSFEDSGSEITFTCDDIGENTVTLVATDANNVTSSADAIVTIVSNSDPEAFAKDITVTLNANGLVTIAPDDIDDGSGVVCGTGNVTLSFEDSGSEITFTCDDIGENTVTLVATDANNVTSSADAIVTVVSNSDPEAFAKDITVTLNANGLVTIAPDDIDDGSGVVCGTGNVTLSFEDSGSEITFTCDDIGENTVTLVATDANNVTSSADAIVTVVSNSDPEAFAKDITVTLAGNGQYTLVPSEIDDGSGVVCGTGNVTLSFEDLGSEITFTCDDIGENTVTLVATDANNVTSSADAIVTVVSNSDPEAFAKDITVTLNANGLVTIAPDDIDDGSGVVCGTGNVTLSFEDSGSEITFTCDDIGENTVTLVATDANNVTSSADAIVTVVSNSDPEAFAKDITVTLAGNGQYTLVPSEIDDGSGVVCGTGNVTLSFEDLGSEITFTCDDIGENTVTLVATDANNVTSSADAIVTVVSNSDPEAFAKDITVTLNANGLVTIAPDEIDNGSGVVCGTGNVTLGFEDSGSEITFTCDDIGENTVTLVATDANNVTSSADAIVTVVEGNNSLTAFAKDFTVVLDANGFGFITTDDIDDGSGAGCNNTVTLSLDRTDFSCEDVGTPVIVTLTVTDENNTVATTAEVTVEDAIAPTVVTQDITVALDGNGQATISAQEIDNGSFDTCGGIDSMSLDIGTFSEPGDVTVTLTVTDTAGNSATETATVTVTDMAITGEQVVAAKGFSPNGDGIGDAWVIENIEDYPGNTVQIFNQWGEAVYEANGYQNDFEGISNKIGNGFKKLPVGPYLYIINYNDSAIAPKTGWLYINY